MSGKVAEAFARLVSEGMTLRGLGLRELCRRADLDPSFLSKVLAGKRNPPSEEEPLRRIALALELDPIELIVSAGRIPSEWDVLRTDAHLVRTVHEVATGKRSESRRRERVAAPFPAPHRGLSEELL